MSNPLSQAGRALAGETQIDMDAAGVVYFSVLVRYHGSLGSNWHFQLWDNPDTVPVAMFRLTGSDGAASMRLMNPSEFDGATTVTLRLAGQGSFLWIGKLSTTAVGNDTFEAWLYRSDEIVPAMEPVAHATNNYAVSNTTINRVFTSNGTGISTDGIDEIRFGEDWNSVLAVVPEPANSALAFGLMAAGYFFLRSRKRGA